MQSRKASWAQSSPLDVSLPEGAPREFLDESPAQSGGPCAGPWIIVNLHRRSRGILSFANSLRFFHVRPFPEKNWSQGGPRAKSSRLDVWLPKSAPQNFEIGNWANSCNPFMGLCILVNLSRMSKWLLSSFQNSLRILRPPRRIGHRGASPALNPLPTQSFGHESSSVPHPL